jgi:very-short-patch-repair endonuclease
LARWQAASVGLRPAVIDNLLRRGRWQRLYQGIYAAHSGEPSRYGILWAAALRSGPQGLLSHYTAAELDGIRGRRTEAIHVTIPHRQRVVVSKAELRGGLPPIVVHRSSRIALARHPVKIPPRTKCAETVLDLVDVAADFDSAFSWLSAACAARLVLPGQIAAAAAERQRLRWRSDVLVALEEIAGGVHSLLERRFYRRAERPHGLPKPKRQYRWRKATGSAYLDVLFAEFSVLVEVDGAAWHPVEARWQDIHRDNWLAREGIITLRYSWADITERPCEVAAEIAVVLRQRGWTGAVRRCGPSCAIAAS